MQPDVTQLSPLSLNIADPLESIETALEFGILDNSSYCTYGDMPILFYTEGIY